MFIQANYEQQGILGMWVYVLTNKRVQKKHSNLLKSKTKKLLRKKYFPQINPY